MQVPASNLFPNRFHRFIRDCWAEADEEYLLPILRSSRPKCVAQKIEFLVRISPPPVIILAIDYFRLLRMKFQPTLSHACGYSCPNFLGFCFRPAMHDGIVSIPLEHHLRILPADPSIKGIVQKQVG